MKKLMATVLVFFMTLSIIPNSVVTEKEQLDPDAYECQHEEDLPYGW